MKKMSLVVIFAALLALTALVLYGCAGSTTALLSTNPTGSLSLSAATTGATLARSVDLPQAKEIKSAKGPGNYPNADTLYNHCNPWYRDRLQIPVAYKVGLVEFKFLTKNDYNDASGYTVNLGTVGGQAPSVTNPVEVDMTQGTYKVTQGGSLPTPGTYTHFGATLVYIEQWLTGNFSSTNPAASSTGKFRLYTSTVGNIQAGDLLIYSNDTWNWINPDNNALTPYTQSRPGGTASGYNIPHVGNMVVGNRIPLASVIQDSFWSLRTTNSLPTFMQQEAAQLAANNYVFKSTLALGAPIVINSNTTYTATMNFNIAQTVDGYFTGANAIAGESGTFFWDDVTNDGLYKPFLPFALGGDSGGDGVHGVGENFPLPPTITISLTFTN